MHDSALFESAPFVWAIPNTVVARDRGVQRFFRKHVNKCCSATSDPHATAECPVRKSARLLYRPQDGCPLWNDYLAGSIDSTTDDHGDGLAGIDRICSDNVACHLRARREHGTQIENDRLLRLSAGGCRLWMSASATCKKQSAGSSNDQQSAAVHNSGRCGPVKPVRPMPGLPIHELIPTVGGRRGWPQQIPVDQVG